jgi:two-component system LytT family response regulator
MTLSAYIVDDEPLAREGLEIRLEDVEGVEVGGSFERAQAAIDAIADAAEGGDAPVPDLLFLDVQMPGLDGFEMLAELDAGATPAVIFVTAYDEYAVRAFDVHAVDYLLKPVEQERLEEAVDQARRRLRQQEVEAVGETLRGLFDDLESGDLQSRDSQGGDSQNGGTERSDAQSDSAPSPSQERIAVRTRGRVMMIRPGEIHYVEGAGDYVELHTGEDSYLLRETMAGIEDRLAAHGFQRIHRSTVVNLDRVRSLDTNEHGAYYVRLGDGTRHRLSRTYREAFEEAIGASF